MARHGGGAFSGKDPSKVDRSAAYAARWVAKNIVAAGLADRAEVQVAYAIGVAHPVSVMVETFGTEKIGRGRIEELVGEHFDLRPGAFREELKLHRPIYQKTAAYGHFGRDDHDFTWERTDKAAALADAAGLAAPAVGVGAGRGSRRRLARRVGPGAVHAVPAPDPPTTPCIADLSLRVRPTSSSRHARGSVVRRRSGVLGVGPLSRVHRCDGALGQLGGGSRSARPTALRPPGRPPLRRTGRADGVVLMASARPATAPPGSLQPARAGRRPAARLGGEALRAVDRGGDARRVVDAVEGEVGVVGAGGVEVDGADAQHAVDRPLAGVDVLDAVDAGLLDAARDDAALDPQPLVGDREAHEQPPDEADQHGDPDARRGRRGSRAACEAANHRIAPSDEADATPWR